MQETEEEKVASQTAEPSGKVSSYGRKAIFASASGYAMDGFDLLILSFSIGAIAADFGISNTAAGSLTSLTLWGAVVGGIVFGIMADRLGRVRVLTWSIMLFAVFTGLCAIAQDYSLLATFRFIAGMGLGGEFGIGMALAAEAWPSRLRARATALVGVGWQFGVLVAALLSPIVIGAWGWRGLFAIGVLPALGAYLIRRRVPEPAHFVARRTTLRESWRWLVSDRVTSRATIGILVLCAVQNFGYYGIMTWLPSYLSKQFGYSLTKSGLWTAITVVGMACGIFVFGILADRIGRKPTFWLYQSGAIVSVLVYSTLSNSVTLLLGGAIMGFFVNGMLGGLGALMAEVYRTGVRASAENILFNLGRAIAGFAPVTVAFVSSQHGFRFAIAMLASIYVLEMIAMFLIPERKGVELV
ncbi:MFS transporter [Micromonospora aurantiaca]|uniref:MFS transporter n=1 Tax=Micromonospora aurantiaca (nom. illeg.) TaxID=47850 RepID=UPI0034512903